MKTKKELIEKARRVYLKLLRACATHKINKIAKQQQKLIKLELKIKKLRGF